VVELIKEDKIKNKPNLKKYSIGFIEKERIALKAKLNIFDKLYFVFPAYLLSLSYNT
jgi:hypothetical protein